ncbi:MAG: glycosyltransferase family 4 protein [Halapricum sp.]
MADIGWVKSYDGRSGGTWVQQRVIDGLAESHSFERVVIEPELHPVRFPRSAWRLATYGDESVDVWVEDVTSLTVKMPWRRQLDVLAFHHLPQPSDSRSPTALLGSLRNGVVERRLAAVDRIVVVSDFWEDYLAERGITENVVKIYNGLPLERFEFDPAEIASVRADLCDDPDRPLVHVGPCAPDKGGHRAYEALAGADVECITTGRKVYDTPVTHHDPPYEEYLKILAACDVLVAMSEFPEGWGLQVQEAMLCRTPVVGSGRGGMGMLLDGGGQLVCRDIEDLEATVARAIADQDRLGDRGYEYASQFPLEAMVEGWRAMFDDLTDS